jgi:tetratricopeptide (TPR) repeat protein
MKLKIKYNRLKSGLYLLLFLALPVFSHGSDATTALFQKGNQQYAKGQYQQAVQSYQQILNDGYQSATIYFNLGNAYYKIDDIPSAVLYFEKAHKLNPGDEDINFNIKLANSKTTDKVIQLPEFFVTSWWHSFILCFSANTLAALSVLLLIAGFGLLALYIFSNSVGIKKSSFYGGIVLICFGVISIFIANRQVNYFNHHHQAIVFSSTVTAKSSPDAAGKPMFVVHEGTKVNVMETNATWIEIELPNGSAGWVTSTDVKEI